MEADWQLDNTVPETMLPPSAEPCGSEEDGMDGSPIVGLVKCLGDLLVTDCLHGTGIGDPSTGPFDVGGVVPDYGTR